MYRDVFSKSPPNWCFKSFRSHLSKLAQEASCTGALPSAPSRAYASLRKGSVSRVSLKSYQCGLAKHAASHQLAQPRMPLQAVLAMPPYLIPKQKRTVRGFLSLSVMKLFIVADDQQSTKVNSRASQESFPDRQHIRSHAGYCVLRQIHIKRN